MADPLSYDQARPIAAAVQAFHTLYRLAIMCTMELSDTDSNESETLLLAIRAIAEKHGKSLDEALGKLSPVSALGVFDPVEEEANG